MNVYCLACGAEFATDATPGDRDYPLNNGVCHASVREARKPNHRLIAENERLRGVLARIADRAKYLSEPAWTLEGCALVGEQIHKWATEALRNDAR